ncbi:MAG: helix-turn-helix domain-containing protein [Candidatus Altiarchaeota archaeon]|nr:helix-turn-helix domain-containing protein [Candidatus Altiarchaeota archaeon]
MAPRSTYFGLSVMVLALLLASQLVVSSSAQESYYADLTVNVDDTGLSSVSGTTNHPQLSPGETELFTSKKAGYWLFNLSLPEEDSFSDYVYAVNLPQGASINYVKASGWFRIEDNDGRISVKGSGNGSGLRIVIQYQMPPSKTDYLPYVLAFLALVLLALAALALKMKYAVLKTPGSDSTVSPPDYDTSALTDRQKDILKIILESPEPVNQALVCEKLGLPKSSVSRNIETLIKKGIVRKERRGMSTMLSPKK